MLLRAPTFLTDTGFVNRQQLKQLEGELWRAADDLRANSDLGASEYSTPVLGLIFLKFADSRFASFEKRINDEFAALQGTRRELPLSQIAIEKCGFYLPPHARYDFLLGLPDEEDIADALKKAMEAIEEYKPELKGALPKEEYARFSRDDKRRGIPKRLLQSFNSIPSDASGDLLGQIYEYFLGQFARAEGQGGGEFFTPRSVVRLMVEMIEPHGGRVFDPACGSGGMFVQSAHFIEAHTRPEDAGIGDFYVFGQEKKATTVNLARMNLAVNNLRGEIKQGITYYDDLFDEGGSLGAFDYVLANPPFNVDEVELGLVEQDARFNAYGIPRNKSNGKSEGKVPNANYLWINLFATSLTPKGRAALVMANSASDARHSEADIRRNLIEANLISAMLSLPSNLFYTVTLPATLWFFDRAKDSDRILFIDARNIFTPVDRAHREFSDEQIENIAVINQLCKGRRARFLELVETRFQNGTKRLSETRPHVEALSKHLLEVLDDEAGRAAVVALIQVWDELPALLERFDIYRAGSYGDEDAHNAGQHELRHHFDPFFLALHDDLKRLDKIVRDHERAATATAREEGKRSAADKKTKALKSALDTLHGEVKSAQAPFRDIHWLQERFPAARYEDVTGLCKLASPEDIEEQDFSLNPGRYVGVVIEEDGKTEEEFIEEMLSLNDDWNVLNSQAEKLSQTISENIKLVTNE